MKRIVVLIVFLFLCFIPNINASSKEINMYLFWGNGCPHCEAEKEYFKEYLKEHKNINVYYYEVWYDEDNQELFTEVQTLLEKKATGVPYLVIGNQVITGFGSTTSSNIERVVNYYLENDYRDIVGEHLGTAEKKDIELKKDIVEEFDIPILGEVNAKEVSLGLSAIILGFIDGFNPCAMWVLLFLITMLFGMKDKKKMWCLGIVFLVTSGLVYSLFMISWLNLAVFLNKIFIIRAVIGLFAIILGFINLIKFFKNKEVACDVIDDKKKNKINKKIEKITTNKKFILSILGIIVLAISVNIIELVCSLGFPVVFTQMLSLNNLNTLSYLLYILIYIVFFMLDDIIIFALAMKTLKITGFSTRYSKISKLIGGIIMIILGILLIFKVEWLMFNF